MNLSLKKKIYRLVHPPLGEVLMLHRVIPKRSILDENRKIEITPDFLEETLLNYKKKGYCFVSLDDIYYLIKNKNKLKQKFVCFTLDDGYGDNYETAYPIFKKYKCPFTIFVTTDFPDKKALLWWYKLEDILIKNERLILSDGSIYDCKIFEEKNRTFLELRQRIFKMGSYNLFKKLNDLFNSDIFRYDDELKYCLTWEQIVELSKDSLCTIACHTKSHPALDNISELEIMEELIKSKKIIEGQTGKEVLHFAYPYGRYNKKVIDCVEKAGFSTAFLANGGAIRKDENLFEMRRNILIQR